MSRMLSASFDSRDETYLDTRIFLVIVDKGVAKKQKSLNLVRKVMEDLRLYPGSRVFTLFVKVRRLTILFVTCT